ncbi:anthocyanidin 3-O-glucosyltransferase 5-like [Prosopis cineraria]|uniref:anthocyanidin 3-O-glucosyltransferase 5-like n=1 Tax=Prosopis cineraria TaxID=364024 RepID=UPI0024104A72|nr:anthocyanidin 3-O-glucosyltransferase 5-like [Prosopis cineraria]
MHQPHMALLSSPGLGHLIPVIELGKLLSVHFNFKVTILAVTSQSSEAESHILKSAISNINSCDILEIPPADLSGLLEDEAAIVERLCVVMRETKGAVRSALCNMASPPSVLIVDIFGYECMSIAEEFRMLKYIFVASNAWFFSLVLYSPILDKQVQGPFVDQQEPFQLPGCSPVRPREVVDPMLDRNTRQYQEYLGIGTAMHSGDAILLNTWEQLQHKELRSLRDENLLGGQLKVPVYAIGPSVRPPEPPRSSTMELLGWLDQQRSESVVYVSFGSGGTLSYEETFEVAWGLELSQLRFIWVVRPPHRGHADSAFFSTTTGNLASEDPSNYLPEGFTDRTRSTGKLVPQWSDQVTILRHPSVGGFLSHCGWSSALESITNGVPMICWPLYAEQRMNATLLAEELGVGVRPKVLPAEKVMGREEIARMLGDVMKGKPNPIRDRARELKESAAMAMKRGGSSYNDLDLVANLCKATCHHLRQSF